MVFCWSSSKNRMLLTSYGNLLYCRIQQHLNPYCYQNGASRELIASFTVRLWGFVWTLFIRWFRWQLSREIFQKMTDALRYRDWRLKLQPFGIYFLPKVLNKKLQIFIHKELIWHLREAVSEVTIFLLAWMSFELFLKTAEWKPQFRPDVVRLSLNLCISFT